MMDLQQYNGSIPLVYSIEDILRNSLQELLDRDIRFTIDDGDLNTLLEEDED